MTFTLEDLLRMAEVAGPSALVGTAAYYGMKSEVQVIGARLEDHMTADKIAQDETTQTLRMITDKLIPNK